MNTDGNAEKLKKNLACVFYLRGENQKTSIDFLKSKTSIDFSKESIEAGLTCSKWSSSHY